MSNMRYYEVTVPSTITIFIKGEELTPDEACKQAAIYAERMTSSENECLGYSEVAFAEKGQAMALTRADVDVTGPPDAVDTTADNAV